MTKNEYLYLLRKNLQILPQNEIDDIINDVHEHFEFALDEGKSEEEICHTLGDPIEMAKQYTGGRIYEEPPYQEPRQRSSNTVLTLIIKIFLIILLIGPILGIYGVLIGFFVAGVAMMICAIPVLLGGILPIVAVASFGMLALIALGLFLLGLGTAWLSIYGFKALTKLVIRFLTFDFGGNQ